MDISAAHPPEFPTVDTCVFVCKIISEAVLSNTKFTMLKSQNPIEAPYFRQQMFNYSLHGKSLKKIQVVSTCTKRGKLCEFG